MTAKEASKRTREALILSPSQLSQHALCPRSWWYKSVERIPVPQHPGAVAGQHAHLQCEKRARGEEYERLPHVEAVSRYLHPPLDPRVEIETTVKLEVSGVRMGGRIDILNGTGTYIDSLGVIQKAQGIPEVGDLKFGMSKFWLSASQLKEDLQQNVYGLAVLRSRFVQADAVRLSLLYASRSAPYDTAKVTVLRSRKDVETWRERSLEPAIESLVATAACEDVSQTRVNLSGCRAYGGCPFESRCTKALSGPELEGNLLASLQIKKNDSNDSTERSKEDSVADLFDNLLNGATGKAPAAPPLATVTTAPPAPAATSVSSPAPSGGDPFADMFAKPAPKAAAAPVAAPAPAAAPAVVTPTAAQIPPTAAEVLRNAEVLRSAAAAAAAAAAAPAPVAALAAAPAAAPAAPAAAAVATPDAAAFSEEPGKRKRGRPRKDAAAPAPAPSEAGRVEVAGEDEDESLYLYVDCIPSRPAQNLDGYVGALCAKVASEFAVPDVRCSVGEGPLSFGKWKGVLAARVRKNPPPPGRWFLIGVRTDDLKAIVATAIAGLDNVADVTYGVG